MQDSWDTYKFHCSGLPKIMTSGRAKDELLGETAKSYLRELWIKERFNRKTYDNVNKYTKKGIMVESDSLEMVSEVIGEKLFKNNDLFENDYICGTPDIANPVVDVKSSWDIFTYFAVDEKKARSDYYWQLVGYMILCKQTKSRLIYSLVNTPLQLAQDELYKMGFNLSEEQLSEAENNFMYDDLPKALRVKVYNFELEKEEEQKLILQVLAARRYLTDLDKEHNITI